MLNQIPGKYTPQEIESKWYSIWEEKKVFSSIPNSQKTAYTIVMPPPNITGILHMGHVLNNTIQDVLARRARMLGKEVCWVPGLDHASIATEAKVVSMLKELGIEKNQLSREEFLSYVWQWKEKYGDTILEQLKKIGCSCDWNRLQFTMDSKIYSAVQEVFVRLYEKKFIYKGKRMVFWDPTSNTALSNDEVIYSSEETNLVYIKYKLADEDGFVTVATTRPETIFGDVAVCINPNDSRYLHLVGRFLIVPILGKIIPIIFDSYTEKDFGSGCLKITPAHDLNDFAIAKKHNLEIVEVIDFEGKLNENTLHYNTVDRFTARVRIIGELKILGLIEKIEKISHNIGRSERTNAVVEPRLSEQWFLKMEGLVGQAKKWVNTDVIKFHPERYKNSYNNWLDNIQDWCLSRQLFWGHRIPAYYLPNGDFVVARSKEEALKQAKTIYQTNEDLTLTQDQDVLDTWFSAWLWPIEVFGGISDPNNTDCAYYYPTDDLITAPEIMFFWVARMIVAGDLFTNKPPFKNVYFTGIVRDQEKRKMSKSLGNSPDPIALINKYGADGVRMGMLLCSAAGNDLLFDEKLCQQGANFANKLWNAYLLIESFEPCFEQQFDDSAISWMTSRLNLELQKINERFDTFALSKALMCIYKLFWDDFCALFLEMIKPRNSKLLHPQSIIKTKEIFGELLKLIHPFMPFVSEEIFSRLKILDKLLIESSWPELNKEKFEDLYFDNFFAEFIGAVRNKKITYNIKQRDFINVYYKENSEDKWIENFGQYVEKMACVVLKPFKEQEFLNCNLIVGAMNFFVEIPANQEVLNNECKKIKKELEYLKSFEENIESKLNNKKFTSNAKKEIIDFEIKKLSDSREKIKLLENRLKESFESFL